MRNAPMKQRIFDALVHAGRRGMTGQEIADVIGWYHVGHGPLTNDTVTVHVTYMRKRGIRIDRIGGRRFGRYVLPPDTLAAFAAVDLRLPLQRLVPAQLLGGKTRHFHDDLKPIGRDVLPDIDRAAADPKRLGNRKPHPARLGNFLQSNTNISLRHSNLISGPQDQVKTD